MTKVVFECLQCGDCCRDLLRETASVLQGLSLSLDEKKLFPKELVLPQMGIGYGVKDWSEPKYTILYQLEVGICPFISDKNKCQIYKTRPLSCRAFPLVSLGPYGTVTAENCRFIKNIEQKLGIKLCETVTPKDFCAPDEWQARTKIDERIKQSFIDHLPDAKVLWMFNLKTKEWEICG